MVLIKILLGIFQGVIVNSLIFVSIKTKDLFRFSYIIFNKQSYKHRYFARLILFQSKIVVITPNWSIIIYFSITRNDLRK